jgi:hypothetical protein
MNPDWESNLGLPRSEWSYLTAYLPFHVRSSLTSYQMPRISACSQLKRGQRVTIPRQPSGSRPPGPSQNSSIDPLTLPRRGRKRVAPAGAKELVERQHFLSPRGERSWIRVRLLRVLRQSRRTGPRDTTLILCILPFWPSHRRKERRRVAACLRCRCLSGNLQ